MESFGKGSPMSGVSSPLSVLIARSFEKELLEPAWTMIHIVVIMLEVMVVVVVA